MTEQDNVVSLMAEHFRRLNARMDRADLEAIDMKMRMSAMEDHLAALVMSNTGINHRLDRLDERIARIERRLDLVDAK